MALSRHNLLKQNAKNAIDALFSDKSVSQSQTRDDLRELIEDMETMIETLQVDDVEGLA